MAHMEVPPNGTRQIAQQRAVERLQMRNALHQLELRLAGKQMHIPCTRVAATSSLPMTRDYGNEGGINNA